MSDTDNQQPQPEAGATDETVALHGAQAREEQYEQPETVALDSDTLIAKTSDDESDNEQA